MEVDFEEASVSAGSRRPEGGGQPTEVLAIGPLVHEEEHGVSGQRMMFQLAVDLLPQWGFRVGVVDLAERGTVVSRRATGRLSLRRVLDYSRVLPRVWIEGLRSRRVVVYLTTAQSRVGFLRDAAMIWPLSWLGHYIVCHQFGGNFEGFYGSQPSLMRAWIRRTLARAAAVIVEGDMVQAQLSFLPDAERKVRVVPNGLPELSAEVRDRPKDLPTGKPMELLYLSNMIETKGYWDVLRAVELLLEQGLDVRCRFVGRFLVASDAVRFTDPGQARAEFFRFLDERPALARIVSYDESIHGAEKTAAFKAAHVFLLPSGYVVEGQPVSILEAMAYGCVTIATRHRMIPMMVEEGYTGLFVPYGSPKAIAERIAYLVEHPIEYRRMSAGAISRFRERFSAESYLERLISILELAAARPPFDASRAISW